MTCFENCLLFHFFFVFCYERRPRLLQYFPRSFSVVHQLFIVSEYRQQVNVHETICHYSKRRHQSWRYLPAVRPTACSKVWHARPLTESSAGLKLVGRPASFWRSEPPNLISSSSSRSAPQAEIDKTNPTPTVVGFAEVEAERAEWKLKRRGVVYVQVRFITFSAGARLANLSAHQCIRDLITSYLTRDYVRLLTISASSATCRRPNARHLLFINDIQQ